MISDSAPTLEPTFTESVIALTLQEREGERIRKQCIEAEVTELGGGVLNLPPTCSQLLFE